MKKILYIFCQIIPQLRYYSQLTEKLFTLHCNLTLSLSVHDKKILKILGSHCRLFLEKIGHNPCYFTKIGIVKNKIRSVFNQLV